MVHGTGDLSLLSSFFLALVLFVFCSKASMSQVRFSHLGDWWPRALLIFLLSLLHASLFFLFLLLEWLLFSVLLSTVFFRFPPIQD